MLDTLFLIFPLTLATEKHDLASALIKSCKYFSYLTFHIAVDFAHLLNKYMASAAVPGCWTKGKTSTAPTVAAINTLTITYGKDSESTGN